MYICSTYVSMSCKEKFNLVSFIQELIHFHVDFREYLIIMQLNFWHSIYFTLVRVHYCGIDNFQKFCLLGFPC